MKVSDHCPIELLASLYSIAADEVERGCLESGLSKAQKISVGFHQPNAYRSPCPKNCKALHAQTKNTTGRDRKQNTSTVMA